MSTSIFSNPDASKHVISIPPSPIPVEVMTARDVFAAHAMQAMLGSDTYQGIVGVNRHERMLAEKAYAVADAMLAARARRGEKNES